MSQRKPRIGCIYPGWWGTGGVETQTLSLISHSREWLDWHGIAITDGGQHCAEHIASLHHMGLLAGNPMDLARKCDAVIVWGYGVTPSWLTDLPCQIIAVSHGAGSDWNRRQLQTVLPYASLVVAVSEYAVTDLPCYRNLPPVVTVPNGLDLSRIGSACSRAQTRSALGFDDDDRLVGFVGRISDEKHPLATAMAVSELDDRYQAVFVGRSFELADWQSRAEQIAPERCHWTGPFDHVGEILQALDCLMIASHSEGGPLIALEAMAAGCPVVATRVGVLRELPRLIGHQTFTPIEHGDSARELAHAVESAIQRAQSPVGQIELALTSQSIIREFSARRMAFQWSEAIQQMLNSQRKAA